MLLKDNPLTNCNLKFASEGKFEGYASVFNSNDKVNDTILPGAFDDAEGKTFPVFINHAHSDIPVGSGVVKQDDYGLFVESNINMEHYKGPSAYSAAKRGDMKGLSIGFEMEKAGYEAKEDGGRVISKADLLEYSLVTFACEPKATVTTVKMTLLEQVETERDMESWIREELHASASVAKALIGHVWRLKLREEDNKSEQISAGKLMEAISSFKTKLESK